MIAQLQSINKIYDLFALCCSYILSNITITPYEFATFNDNEYEHIYDAIETYNQEKEYQGSRKAFEELRDYLIGFMNDGVNIEKCYAIVKNIDDLIEAEINEKLIGSKHIVQYSALNEQYRDCVQIIPVMKNTLLTRGNHCFQENGENEYSLFRKRRDCVCSVLDEALTNYIVRDKRHIKDFPMKICRIGEKSQIFKHFCDREKIVFGIIPFTDKKLEEILQIGYNQRAFYVEYMHKNAEVELKKKYEDVYKRCETEDIDFLIFPEMLMTDKILAVANDKKGNKSPQFIINGSIWEDFSNKSIVTDGSGNEIFSYYKKVPFKFEKDSDEYVEHLNSQRNQEYFIIEIDGLGRIGICICKDLTNETVKMFHKCIRTNILLVPAYSKSMDLKSSAETLAEEYNCIVVVANACSALSGASKEGKRIGFITVPAKNKSDRTKITKMYEQNECISECDKKCVGKKILIDFYHTENYTEGVSFKMIESLF